MLDVEIKTEDADAVEALIHAALKQVEGVTGVETVDQDIEDDSDDETE